MAKKRTRQQKEKIQKQRGQVKAPALSPSPPLEPLLTNVPAQPPVVHSLLRVDQKYLRSDLRRSVTVSLLLLIVLIGISVALRYNGLTMVKGIGN